MEITRNKRLFIISKLFANIKLNNTEDQFLDLLLRFCQTSLEIYVSRRVR